MVNYNLLGMPIKKGKKQTNMFGDFNIGNVGLMNDSGSNSKSRDIRRSFSLTQRKEILYQQGSKCAKCHKQLDPRTIEYDHMKPWASGGRTVTVNGRALCKNCHGIVTHETKLKEVDKKRKSPPKNDSLFGGSSIFVQPKRSGKNKGGLFGGF